ncbi:phytase [Neptunicella sp. SCSIO 80796]|uniref:phytase n=1 Tax=Neptunicella plasticusilytica TaxID=3117012 RepID=UPI003A4D95D0
MNKLVWLTILVGLLISGCQSHLDSTNSIKNNNSITIRSLPENQAIAGKVAMPITHQQQQYWLLTSESKGVLFTDQDGNILSQYAGNMEILDWRDDIQLGNHPQGIIATVDNESGHILLLGLDWRDKKLSLLTQLETGQTAAETLCWHTMPQGHLSLFVADSLGTVEQRLVYNADAGSLTDIPIRTFIGVPQVKSCAVDDASESLYLAEENIGVWRYPANAEAELQRDLIAASSPNGQIEGEISYVNVMPDGNLLVTAPEQQGVWRIDSAQKQPPAFYAIPQSQGIESVTSTLADNKLLLGLFDDNSGLYYQAQAPFRINKNNNSTSRNATLLATAQTTPVSRFGDAADDPAIWINHQNPQHSLILGTNKKQGMMVYDLQGNLLQQLDVGRVNNVDLRYGFKFDNQTIDIAAATNRSSQSISLFGIEPDSGKLSLLTNIATDIDDVYGLCMYQNAEQYYVFINGTDGRFQQYLLQPQGDKINAQKVREFKVASQPEGCVADDRNGQLYFGEEAVGIWQVTAMPSKSQPHLIATINQRFVADVEGMGIYHLDNQRFLIASSQGNNSYGVFALDQDNRYLGSFDIGMNINNGIDGVSETDGLEITSIALGEAFPDGLMVAQDGRNMMPAQPQNFKLISTAGLNKLIRNWLKL